MSKTLTALHRNYIQGTLNRSELPDVPYELFSYWLSKAEQQGILDFNAMNVATVGLDQRITSRIVLLKSHNPNGLIFYTDNRSKKAQQLAQTAIIAAHFYWPQLERQIRIEGSAQPIDTQQSVKYFLERPRNSQISSIASHQSQIIPNRNTIDQKVNKLALYYQDQPIPPPKHWQGYQIKPTYWEFWQGRLNRTHDRFQYELVDNQWIINRLSP